ncbi:MAG: TlyA family RNA methyltransferase [Provencibacterium sp.]|jgi:23S rRNA (cytidine1920-2'-O)/16S rRNA (cytidine1409-2'-O)-methyltransferase|nr:TlyA family RNA methyltransferase [Provencibacterium sp.]
MKQRLDVLLFSKGLAESREAARRFIMAGEVYVDGQKCDKPGQAVPENGQIELRGEKERFVSRGGHKLEKAMAVFPLELSGKVCMDIGASTGGFTDCMLQHGAREVYAVDVGYGQLAWKLREDPRVHNLERVNVRYLTEEQVPQKIGFISIDVSFISLTLVLPVARHFLEENGELVALIKPQFEAGREKVGKKGVVRDPTVHQEVIDKVIAFTLENGFQVCGLDYSPIKGPQGNIEYLIWLRLGEGSLQAEDTKALVARAHQALD